MEARNDSKGFVVICNNKPLGMYTTVQKYRASPHFFIFYSRSQTCNFVVLKKNTPGFLKVFKSCGFICLIVCFVLFFFVYEAIRNA